MSARIDRTGERRLMNCGDYATIIRYGSAMDIDVKFDSGEIVYNRLYVNFKAGRVAKGVDINRVGERRLMHCGEYATIIRYDSYTDIDVKFDSGEVIKNRSYGDFIKCTIKKPIADRLGERRLMNCGEYATIIRYGNSSDIDVKFDTGEILYNKRYSNFVRGSMSPSVNHLGERHLMDCGEYATIIRYGSYNDIDVRFDSGEVVSNKRYDKFINGSLSKYLLSSKVEKNRLKKVGERRLMNCGEYATIIRYGRFNDIDVKFDSGEVALNRRYDSFLGGRIAKPVLVSLEEQRVGERRLMNCGEYATIIAYRKTSDIDIKFDSGEIVLEKTYSSFKNGNIAKPGVKYSYRLGERRIMNCGEYVTIIKYESSSNITVQFDTGEIVSKRSYRSFILGEIARPLDYKIGEKQLMKCGLYGTIIKYTSYTDVDIELSSGDIIKNCNYADFKSHRCIPDWFIRKTMRMCYYDSVLNDTVILMKDGTVKKKSEL